MCAPGKTVCKWHGGKSTGAPKNNKNAVKHGAYEKVSRETLFPDEIDYMDGIEFDPVEILKEQIQILKVKELRLARKMKDVLLAEKDAGKEDKTGKKKPSTTMLTVTTTQSQNPDGETSKVITSNSETWEMHYLRLENVHTGIMNEIRRATNNLHKLLQEQGLDTGNGDEAGVLITPGILSEEEWTKYLEEK